MARAGKVLSATNRDLRKLPDHLRVSAEAEVARKLAADFDAGHAPSGVQLMKVLAGLRRLAVTPVAVEPEEVEADGVDDLASRRQARRAEAAAVQRAEGGKQRGSGGRRAR